MTPLSKVVLQTIEDNDSGPHSILFLDTTTSAHNENNTTFLTDTTGCLDRTKLVVKDEKNRTFDKPTTDQERALKDRRRTFELKHSFTILSSDESSSLKCFTPKAINLKTHCHSTPWISSKDNNGDSLILQESLEILAPHEMQDGFLSFTTSSSFREKLRTSVGRKSDGKQIDQDNKRDSLELDDSLGILSESQMQDYFASSIPLFNNTLSLNWDNKVKVSEQNQPHATGDFVPKPCCTYPECPSPSMNSSELSLGLLDEKLLENNETLLNMDLTFDKAKNFLYVQRDQTPSPEELPLDPPAITEISAKIDASKSKTNSCINSIASITSLDTGYQGDGEMSRPGSRAGENATTRRPPQRVNPCRREPLTDSDFFTESDADNLEEPHLRGDRRAQVIDGTLYGVDAQAAADIFVNNRDNLESSGVFTDIDSNNILDPPINQPDVSPSESVSKTISENSQTNSKCVCDTTIISQKSTSSRPDNPKKRTATSPSIGSPNVVPPKREKDSRISKSKSTDSQSKTKILSDKTNIEKRAAKKPAGRWDAVMNKISKNDANKTNFKDVKSKVFNSLSPSTNSSGDIKRNVINSKLTNQKSPNVKTTSRLVPPPKTNTSRSFNSSMSDLSISGSSAPNKKLNGSVKSVKKKEVPRVTQVLNASKFSPRSIHSAVDENKRSPSKDLPPIQTKTAKKNVIATKEKKEISNKENGRTATKGGRTSPSIKTATQVKVPHHTQPRTAEALAVLVQHLVFNVGAFQVPHLRKQVEKLNHEAEQLTFACRQLDEKLAAETQRHALEIEDERSKCQDTIEGLLETHRQQVEKINAQQRILTEQLAKDSETSNLKYAHQQDEKLSKLKIEFEKLQRTHVDSLDILREENEAIREEIDIKNEQIKDAKHESLKLKEDYEAKEFHLKEQIHQLHRDSQRHKQELANIEQYYKNQIKELEDKNELLAEDNKRLLSYGDGVGISVQEVESLRVVLELKQNEVAELRRSLAEATQKADFLTGCEEKVACLQARCEDLKLQLERKCDLEQTLLGEKQKMEDSYKEEINQNRRLSQYNEELQWKLKQSKEVFTKIMEHKTDDIFSKSFQQTTAEQNPGFNKLERNHSFRDSPYLKKSSSNVSNNVSSKKLKNSVDDEDSPPASPTIKGVVEKSDSVSYVLDLNESPDVVASRIVRRSFRTSTPPKTTPTKSPSASKRIKTKNSLSISSSANSISPTRPTFNRSRSSPNEVEQFLFITSTPMNRENCKLDEIFETNTNFTINNLDLYDENCIDLDLPDLPSEINGKKSGAQSLPAPKHLAREPAASESNSDDESTSSSSGQL